MTVRDLICMVFGCLEAQWNPHGLGKACPRCGKPEYEEMDKDSSDYEAFRKRYWRA